MSVEAERNGFRGTTGKCIAVMLIYAFLGPLLGLLTFSLGMGAIAREPGIVLFTLMFGFLFAYLMGFVSAILAGTVAIGLHLLVRGLPHWIGPISGLVSLGVAAGLNLPAGRLPREGHDTNLTIVLVATHLVPAILMWLLARVMLRPSLSDAATTNQKESV